MRTAYLAPIRALALVGGATFGLAAGETEPLWYNWKFFFLIPAAEIVIAAAPRPRRVAWTCACIISFVVSVVLGRESYRTSMEDSLAAVPEIQRELASLKAICGAFPLSIDGIESNSKRWRLLLRPDVLQYHSDGNHYWMEVESGLQTWVASDEISLRLWK